MKEFAFKITGVGTKKEIAEALEKLSGQVLRMNEYEMGSLKDFTPKRTPNLRITFDECFKIRE